MDKETLSNYGWIVIAVMVLVVMIALATPFGQFVSDAVKNTTKGLFDVNRTALNSTGLLTDEQKVQDQTFGDEVVAPVMDKVTIDDVEYDFEVGMTWQAWFDSEYNTDELWAVMNDGMGSRDALIYDSDWYNREEDRYIHNMVIDTSDEIIAKEIYWFIADGTTDVVNPGKPDTYYEIGEKVNGYATYNQKLHTN